KGRGGGIGAMGRFRHQDAGPRLAARRDGGTDGQKPAQFAMGARLGRHGHRRHAGQGRQPCHQLRDQFQRALGGGLRRQGMQVAEARQPRHLLVQARIVLHGAGAERIKPAVDGIVHARQPHIVAHHFRLAEARQADGAVAAQAAQLVVADFHIRQIDANGAMAQFEDQRLFMVQTAIAGNRRHAGAARLACPGRTALIVHAHYRTSCSALASAAKSSSVLVSVAARISRFSTFLSRGRRREAGTPAITPLAASASTMGAAGLGSLMVNSLKKAGVTTSTPGTALSLSAKAAALAWLRRASRVSPSSPSSDRWMVKAKVQRPLLVQMLLVAFSRRICCSRVESVSTKPRRPSTSRVSPTTRPGIWRTNFSRTANRPRCGPPKPGALPNDWPSAATMSAPISPGGFTKPSDTASATTTTSSAPARWQASASSDRSRTSPNEPGFCTTTQEVSPS